MTGVTGSAQLDLFGTVLAQERQHHRDGLIRRRDGLVCLGESVTEALEIVVELRYGKPKNTRSPSACGGWAFCVCRAGLRYEPVNEWRNGARNRGETCWDRAPAHLLTWDELVELVGQDPRRAEMAAWAQSLPGPNWRPLGRPYEFRPDPEEFNSCYIERDRGHRQWPARRQAWGQLLDLLVDAIDTLNTVLSTLDG